MRFSKTAELVKMETFEPGNYLFKIVDVKEKTSQAGNDYWLVKFESKEGVKVSDIFLFDGKGATKTLGLFSGLGLADYENFPDDDIEPDDILGKYIYIDTIKDKDSDYLKCPWDTKKYQPYKKEKSVKKPVIDEEELPF